MKMKAIQYEAHRGISSDYPENTMPAFRAAADAGFDMIEFDPKYTSDGEIVILHDKTVGRTARRPDGSPVPDRLASELTFSALRALDFGVGFGARFAGTVIPTFRELCDFALARGIALKVDNVWEKFPPAMQEKLLCEAEASGLGNLLGFTVSDPGRAAVLCRRFPLASIHYDGATDDKSLSELGRTVPADRLTVWVPIGNRQTAFCHHAAASPELLGRIHGMGAKCGVWIFDTPEELAFVRSLGADILETTGKLRPITSRPIGTDTASENPS